MCKNNNAASILKTDVNIQNMLADAMVIQRGLYLKYLEIYEEIEKKVSESNKNKITPESFTDKTNQWLSLQKPFGNFLAERTAWLPNVFLNTDVIIGQVEFIAAYNANGVSVVATAFGITIDQAIDLIKFVLSNAESKPKEQRNEIENRNIVRLQQTLLGL